MDWVVGGCGEKNPKNDFKVIFRGTILGVFFFSSPGGGQGGLTNHDLLSAVKNS